MALDYKNIDWGAMLKSQVVLGSAVTIITSLMALGGHAMPADQQTQLTQAISSLLGAISTLAGFYTLYHRVSAQPEHQTVIIPQKQDNQNNMPGAPPTP